MPYYVLMPVFTEDILGVGASGLGILFSVSGAGAIVGSLILASLPNKRRGLLFLIGSLALSLALIGFAFSGS
jgi:predicted MFS family arabinose efflux permease